MKLEEIFTFENLYGAYIQCRKSKQHKGEVIRFEANLSLYLVKLMKEIMSQKYRFGEYKIFKIYDPKERTIQALCFKDRIVIRCFCDHVLRPKIERHLIYDNSACRKTMGTDFSIMRLEKFLRHEYLQRKNNDIYFLKCDIRKFFQSIDHEVLLSLLQKISFSKEEMWFIEKLIHEQPNRETKGLPLGNQSSQWFALFYLNTIDHYIKEVLRIHGYVRYMDDMILIHRDKGYLQKCLKQIEEKCKKELKLELNEKTQIGRVCDGIQFLGYRHILTEKGSVIRKLSSSSKKRMTMHLKTMYKLRKREIVDDAYVLCRRQAFYNHVKDTKGNRKLKMDVRGTDPI